MTSASVAIRVAPGRSFEIFELVLDEDDGGVLPVRVAPYAINLCSLYAGWRSDGGNPVPVGPENLLERDRLKILAPLTRGVAALRLYAPRSAVSGLQVRVLDVITSGGAATLDTSSWDRPVEPIAQPGVARIVGRRVALMEEVVEFRGETEQRLRYSYDDPASEILSQTIFVDDQGQSVQRPRPVHGDRGRILAEQPCYGSLVVRYAVEYTLLRVEYPLVPTDALRLAWIKATLGHGDVVWPEFEVMATAGKKIALLRVRMQVGNKTPIGVQSDSICGGAFYDAASDDPCYVTDAMGRRLRLESCKDATDKTTDESDSQQTNPLLNGPCAGYVDPFTGSIPPHLFLDWKACMEAQWKNKSGVMGGLFRLKLRETRVVEIACPDDPTRVEEMEVDDRLTFLAPDGVTELVLDLREAGE